MYLKNISLINFRKFINKTNILHSTHSGFRKGHSCQTTLLHLVNKWATEIDKGNMVGTLFLDLIKAFNFVNHDLLLNKLTVYYFSQHSIDVFKSYLRNRKQLVQIDKLVYPMDLNLDRLCFYYL